MLQEGARETIFRQGSFAMFQVESAAVLVLSAKDGSIQASCRHRVAKQLVCVLFSLPGSLLAAAPSDASHANVTDQVIQSQQEALAKNTGGKGFGPQSPRDIDSLFGRNLVLFGNAPKSSEMNLCNIHFHKNAEHKGGQFTKYAGNGDGHGYGTGYKYVGELSASELTKPVAEVCPSKHGGLYPGDTIEVHYVYSSARVDPGPSLGACLNDAIKNPQLRVEAQVMVLVNDAKAKDFRELAKHGLKGGVHQALNIPADTGKPIQYGGSTTGPAYNEQGSPFQVSWSVRPLVTKVHIETVGEWCKGNVFKEDHAHGVRNLVGHYDLLSPINP